jgi:hypothetical protein
VADKKINTIEEYLFIWNTFFLEHDKGRMSAYVPSTTTPPPHPILPHHEYEIG